MPGYPQPALVLKTTYTSGPCLSVRLLPNLVKLVALSTFPYASYFLELTYMPLAYSLILFSMPCPCAPRPCPHAVMHVLVVLSTLVQPVDLLNIPFFLTSFLLFALVLPVHVLLGLVRPVHVQEENASIVESLTKHQLTDQRR